MTTEVSAAGALTPAAVLPERHIGHHFTVDVEEYFQVSAFERIVRRAVWHEQTTRLRPSMTRLLDVLEENSVRGTFFVLGWIGRRYPSVVVDIASRGHEVASHGWGHRRVTDLTIEEFARSVRESKHCLEDIVGKPVVGYRAPSFSIVPGTEWALDVLIESGYLYDSSLFPISRSGYGYPGGGTKPYWLTRAGGRLAEFPPATWRFGAWNVPAAGGGYFRIFPYGLTRRSFIESSQAGYPGTFYIHPWEIDPAQPRLRVPLATRFRHYTGLHRTVPRLQKLLSEFRFDRTMSESMEAM